MDINVTWDEAKMKPSLTSSGSSTNVLSKLEVIEKIKQISPAQFYVWDGQDLDDKPLTQEQLSKAIKGNC
jgi:adenylosuccinate synthase